MAHNHPTSTTTNPTIHITILTIETLLIFSVLILIIGPSRILSESSSTSCTCPQIHINISNPQPSSSPSSPSHHDGIHQRIYNTSAALEATAKSPANPFTWEEILTPPVITYGIRIQKESLNHLDDDPDIEAEAEPAEGGHHGHSHSPGHSSDEIGFVISLEHQLHCLTAIRGLIFPNNTNTSLNSSNTPWQEKTMELNYGHWSHCFDYLAQTILCAADDTLERPKKLVYDGKVYWRNDGAGATHQCRDPRLLWEISVRSQDKPMNMTGWKEGIGAREFFAKELEETGYKYEIPESWSLGVV